MSDTTKTDGQIYSVFHQCTGEYRRVVPAEFARGLERKITRLTGDCEAWNRAYHEEKKLRKQLGRELSEFKTPTG